MRSRNLLASRALLVVCLLASFALNAALIYGLVHFFRSEQTLRLDPFELDHWAADPLGPDAPAGQRRVIFFGDSRARQWRTPRGVDGFEFVNRGVGLQTTAQVLGRFERDLAAHRPSIVVLQLGVNDLKARGDEARLLARCQQNIAQLVQRSAALGAHVVLSTIFSLGGMPWLRALYIPSETMQRVQRVNAYLRGLASPQVSVLDSQRVLDDAEGSVRSDYRVDLLHVNEAGYAALNRVLVSMLRALPAR